MPTSEFRYSTAVLCSLIIACVFAIIIYVSQSWTANGYVAYAHDGLDSSVVNVQTLVDSGKLFADNDDIVPNALGGLPRAAYPTEFDLIYLIYSLFDTESALTVNEALLRLFAFLGMLLLSMRYLIKNLENRIANTLFSATIALCYALLPYWPHAGGAIALQPLILYAFLNLLNEDRRLFNWAIIALCPFYSSIVFAGLFQLTALGLILLTYSIARRSLSVPGTLALGLLTTCYVVADYRLFANMIDPVFISHRVEMVPKYLDANASWKKATKTLAYSQYHAHSLHLFFLAPVIALAILSANLNKWFGNRANAITLGLFAALLLLVAITTQVSGQSWQAIVTDKFSSSSELKLLLWLFLGFMLAALSARMFTLCGSLLCILLICLWAGFEDYQGIRGIKESFALLNQIQTNRFYVLLATLWFVAAAIGINHLASQSVWHMAALFILFALQLNLSFEFQNSERSRLPATVNNYYKEALYEKAKNTIGLPVESYRVMSIHQEPAVALYNGFYTLDGYFPTYPLKHKHEFRKIIAHELQRSQKERKYFDNWGSRCQLRSRWRNVRIDLSEFKKMGGRFIFSPISINIYHQGKSLEPQHVVTSGRDRLFIYDAGI